MSAEVNLDPQSIEAVAQRVAELLQDGGLDGEMIDAAEVARRFGVTRDYVYTHAGRLGAIPLSSRPKARLRFDPKRVAKAMRPAEVGSADRGEAPKRARRPRRRKRSAELLPIRGERP